MPLSTFQVVVDKIPGLKNLWLFNWGEPFLNPALFDMIDYAGRKSIRVTVHTNFSFHRDDSFFADVVASGLDRLTLSLDGASQASYSKYRVRGDFDLVIANVHRLIRARALAGSDTPVITWKFVVNRHNEHEIAQARAMAADLGIEFQASPIGLSDDLPDADLPDSIEQRKADWLPTDLDFVLDRYVGEYRTPLHAGPCTQLTTTLVVGPDGKVFPCCWVTDPANAFGDLLTESIEEIWANSTYRYSRSLFARTRYRGPRTPTVCLKCMNFTRVRA